MTKKYTIIVSGYEPIRAEWTLKEARKELSDILRGEMSNCKRRFGKAFLHMETPNTGSITLARDRRSLLWCAATIVPL